MTEPPIEFTDGEAYERGMGPWSQLVGRKFIDWLNPQPGMSWIDIGCGNGSFAELVVQRCSPTEIHGLDPSAAQIAFARNRLASSGALFQIGEATALPFQADRFDVAVMALVLFFIPEPATGVSEMARVVVPGGIVAAYLWDLFGDQHPGTAIQAEFLELGVTPVHPTSARASSLDALRALWAQAGLQDVETRKIEIFRTFEDFDEMWESLVAIPNIGPTVASMSSDDIQTLKCRLKIRQPADPTGRITVVARANAIKGRVVG